MWNTYNGRMNCPANTGYAPNDPRSAEPTAQNAHIGMTTPAVVSNNGVIPLDTIFNNSGANISGTNPISLMAGHKYLVEYSVIGKPAAAIDAFGVKLRLNGVDVPGSASAAAAVAAEANISGGAIVTVTGTSGTNLTLVGISTTTATYNIASMRIVEVQ